MREHRTRTIPNEPPDDVSSTAKTNGRAKREGRVPPHDVEAERSLLGAMLLARDAVGAALDQQLTGADFYRPAHGHIYDAVVALYNAGEPADPVTVAAELRRSNTHDLVDDGELVAIQGDTPSTSSAAHYSRLVADTAVLRRLLAVAGEIAEVGYTTGVDVATALDRAEALVLGVARADHNTRTRYVRDALDEHLQLLEARHDGTVPGGVPTGLRDLDDIIGGLHPGQLIVAAGRPGMGKSAIGLTIGNNAGRAGHTTLWTSIEMGETELLDRLIASESHLDQTSLRRGQIAARDWERVSLAIGRLAETQLIVDDHPGATVTRIAARARRTKNLALVVVDYLQLVAPGQRGENRQTEVAEISVALKRLARDLKIPVLALAQLNRAVEQRADKRPLLSDLRDSGQIEQDSDVVIGLYRDEVYKPDTPDRGLLEAIVLKQRNGPLGTARLAFHASTQRITDLAKEL